jgi:hypothetical protein
MVGLQPFFVGRRSCVILLLIGLSPASAQPTPPSQFRSDLPQGSAGIAAAYPGDVGIDTDPRVVFVEDFEQDSMEQVKARWEAVKADQTMSLVRDVPSGGGRSLQIRHVGGRGDGAHLYRRLQPGFDKLYFRFYVKFDPACAPIHHFFHVGGYNPTTPWPQGGAGERPRGDERFSTGVEPFGEQWRWDYYSYWMEMRGSPPRGQTWGNSFIHDRVLAVPRGEWICAELMMKMNDIGASNGEMALWIDGRLASHLGQGFPRGKWDFDKFRPGEGGQGITWSDETKRPEPLEFPVDGSPFEGFRWRSDERLNLNFLWLLCYITRAPQDHVSTIWFDQIVVAKEYIGPIETQPNVSIETPR